MAADSCSQNTHAAKLTRSEVTTMRTWARTDGFGLRLFEQVAVLQAQYPQVRETALADVLTNRSFFDPAYQRDLPLVVEQIIRGGGPSWLCTWLIAWLLILRTSGIGIPSPVFNASYYVNEG